MFDLMILISFCLSLDALGLGISYGIKNVHIGLIEKTLLFVSSILYSFCGLYIGKVLLTDFGEQGAKIFGVVIIILIGLWMIFKSAKESERSKTAENNKSQKKIFEFALKSIGITVMVLKDPVRGDIDNSGKIDCMEAVLLGIALNVDAAAACLGSVMVGISTILMPFFIGFAQLVLIQTGLSMGRKIGAACIISEKLVSIIPGIVLICLAFFKLFS